MAIRFACPKCHTPYTVIDQSAGKKAECKVCGQRVQVPTPPPPPKTILGELLPPTGGPAKTATPAPVVLPMAASLQPSRTPPPKPKAAPKPAAGGPIKFGCPGCQTAFTVNRRNAGMVMDCPKCAQWVTVPGEPVREESEPESRDPEPPQPDDQPEPARLDSGPDRPTPREERWHDQVEEDYGPPPERRRIIPSFLDRFPATRRPNAPVNRIVAGVGAGLILIALFLPMITGPFGVWMSFIDVPWKAVTVGFAIIDEVKTERRSDPDFGRARVTQSDPPPDPGKTARGFLVVLVGIGSVVFPLFVLATLGITGYQMAAARSSRGYFAGGLLIGLGTVVYAIGLLMLNTVPEMRRAMILVSPGFGWAVLIVGTAALCAAGLIRVDPRSAAY